MPPSSLVSLPPEGFLKMSDPHASADSAASYFPTKAVCTEVADWLAHAEASFDESPATNRLVAESVVILFSRVFGAPIRSLLLKAKVVALLFSRYPPSAPFPIR